MRAPPTTTPRISSFNCCCAEELCRQHWEVRKSYHPRQLLFVDESHSRGRDVGKRRRGYGRY
eukprot:COSAG02_NODE_34889_length_477_cov_0.544974_1_plen_61_part_01